MSTPVCEKCGQRHERAANTTAGAGTGAMLPTCSGHVRYDKASYVPGEPRKLLDQPRPCMQHRPADSDPDWKCDHHGAGAPQVKRARERRMAESKAEALVRRWGVPIETTPIDAILGQINVFAGLELFYRTELEALPLDERIWGITKETEGDVVVPGVGLDRSEGQVREAKPHILVDLHERASRELRRAAVEALNAGIAERQVRIAEQTGTQVAETLRRISDSMLATLTAAGLTAELANVYRAAFAEAAPRELRLLVS